MVRGIGFDLDLYPQLPPQQTTSPTQSSQTPTDSLETEKPTYKTQGPEKKSQTEDKPQEHHKKKDVEKKKKKTDDSLIKEQKPSFDEYLRKKKEKGLKDLKFDDTPKEKALKPQEKPPEKIEQAKKDTDKRKETPLPEKGLPSEKTTAKHLEHVEKKEAKKAKELTDKKKKDLKKGQEKTLVTGEEKPLKTQTTKTTSQEKTKLSESEKAAQTKNPLLHKTAESHDASKDHEHDKKDKERKAEELAEPAQAAPIDGVQAPQAPTETPVHSKIHPQVYDLLEKMVGVMTIEQHKGVTTTTITVNMKGSVFDGSEIVLEHYSTAPNAFNVQLAGSQDAQALFNANIDELAAAFASGKYAFDVNIRKPILLKEHQAFTRKEKTSREEEGKKDQ